MFQDNMTGGPWINGVTGLGKPMRRCLMLVTADWVIKYH
jgi:hypothetical protein